MDNNEDKKVAVLPVIPMSEIIAAIKDGRVSNDVPGVVMAFDEVGCGVTANLAGIDDIHHEMVLNMAAKGVPHVVGKAMCGVCPRSLAMVAEAYGMRLNFETEKGAVTAIKSFLEGSDEEEGGER